jgi:hypothetical protein
MEKLMPNMLDYERLVRQVADLSVENARLKGHHRNGEDDRWNTIEEQAPVGTLAEERRLRRIIRDWEERYDVLCELFMRRDDHKPNLNWHDAKADLEYRRRKQAEAQAKTEKRLMWLRIVYTKIKNIWIIIKGKMK